MPKPEKIRANRNVALVAVILCMVFSVAAFVMNIKYLQGKDLSDLYGLIGCVISTLLYLKLLLPIPQGKHRQVITMLLAVSFVCSIIYCVGIIMTEYMLEYSNEDLLATFAMVVGMFFLASPQNWMLIGALRRKSMALAAAAAQAAFLVIFLLGALLILFEVETSLFIAEGICFLILLCNWPVLERPILAKEKPMEIEPLDEEIEIEPPTESIETE